MLFYFSCLLAAVTASASTSSYVRYIVLGSGPGGLQIAHYLESAGRDYLVIDRAKTAGSFFADYPRWRQLISINKREVGRSDSLAFAERHDWNSLLSDASHALNPARAADGVVPITSSTDARLQAGSIAASLRFTSWSDEYYPSARTLQAYIEAWASAGNHNETGLGRNHALRVRFGVNVTRIERPSDWRGDTNTATATQPVALHEPRFLLHTTSGETLACTFLILATGLQEVVPLPGPSGKTAIADGLVQTYTNAIAEANAYRGKRVLILGHGNAAFEFAHHILPVAAYVHIAGRDTHRLQLALETHYPGHVRAIHASLLETYNLKSLDGITSADFSRLTFTRTDDGRVAVSIAASPCRTDPLGRPTSRCSFRKPYDVVIACLGWRFSRDIFAPNVVPLLAANIKHPALTPRYESTNVQGLYFAGTLAHGADYRRSSGGFIHGLRYTARALHRILEEEENAALSAVVDKDVNIALDGSSAAVVRIQRSLSGVPPQPWPVTCTKGLRRLVALLLRRINNSAGLYQMFGQLADVFVFDSPVARDVAGFVTAGPHAAMHEPWSYFDTSAASAAASGSDPSGIAADVVSSPFFAQSARPPQRPASVLASEAAIDAALAGGLREEVPVTLAASAAQRWSRSAVANDFAHGAAEWLQVTLEFGLAPPAGAKDPFALDRCVLPAGPMHLHACCIYQPFPRPLPPTRSSSELMLIWMHPSDHISSTL